ncbi:hypothetical protein GGX14DRAFT_387427 [Mycena pura]|uniref:Uncharacterized protein n=1 Tax=Mycena pura TaxID=153505 RepID=A0AAD6YLD4_9AGAR|nr:hypothetical protein GGX14DRAFT_387427 [Mycena pura]
MAVGSARRRGRRRRAAKHWVGLSFWSKDVPAAMRDGTSLGEPESESAARARAWIAEAAVEREKSHYVPITASWALSDPRLQKLERAARRTRDRVVFDARSHLDRLPPQGLQYIAEVRHLRRVRYAAGGDTQVARFAVCDASQRQAAARGEEWAVRLLAEAGDDRVSNRSPWHDVLDADVCCWAAAVVEDMPNVGRRSVEPGIGGNGVEDSAVDVIEDDADGDSDGPVFMIARTVSPEPWWVFHPGNDLEEVDDAPSPATYSRSSL